MQNYTPIDAFSTVKTFELSDLVQADDTYDNQPVKALADRSQYLYNRLGGYAGIVDVTATGNITAATHANKLISVAATANVILTVANVSTFKTGARLCFIAKITGTGPFWCKVVTGQNIEDGSVTSTEMYLYDGEMIELVADTVNSIWKLVNWKGNFEKVGQDELKRLQPRNSLMANGNTSLSRATYARLWAAVSGIAVSESDKSDIRYQAMFGNGNGSTTFSVPDLRGLFWRAIDLSRGLDLGRLDDTAGGFEDMEIEQHNHTLATTNGAASNSVTADPVRGTIAGSANTQGGLGSSKSIGQTGGAETRPKNIGMIPIIYY
jgi:microcystin-dependent protein